MSPDAKRRPLSSAGAVSNQFEDHETLTGIVVRGWC